VIPGQDGDDGVLLNEFGAQFGAKLRLDAPSEAYVDLTFHEGFPLMRRGHLDQRELDVRLLSSEGANEFWEAYADSPGEESDA
jgi:hypothetical protein